MRCWLDSGNLRVLTKICMMTVVLWSKRFEESRGYVDVERLNEVVLERDDGVLERGRSGS